MPSKPPRPCSFPNCPNLVTGKDSLCPKHRKLASKRYEKTRETAVQRGYTTRWRKLRKMVLARQPMCLCDECRGENKPADIVHHIDGNAKNNNLDNLLPMNDSCHNKLHVKQGDRF